ncbi:MAG: hypothetical protein ACO3CR_03535 [Solirubrobacterales bacterium]
MEKRDDDAVGNAADELRSLSYRILDRLTQIEIRLDSLEASVETFGTVDLDQALDDIRAEVRSIKDEML